MIVCVVFVFVNFFTIQFSENIEMNKLEEIKDIIIADHLAADAKISVFTSAALSFKRDSLLSPFPKNYIVDGIKNFEKLVSDDDLNSTY